MALGDKAVLAAMDGQVPSVAKSTPESKISTRDEPAAYFFVIFGLVFEALTASDSNSSPDTRASMTAALETLKYIVRPEYAGSAVLDLITFDEMMSLAYRMVMTETAAVQIQLVSAIASLATSRRDTVLRSTQTERHVLLYVYTAFIAELINSLAGPLRRFLRAHSSRNA